MIENKWYVLFLSTFTVAFGIAAPTMGMPVLFKEISEDLSLNLVQLGTVWGMVAFAGIFIFLIGGMLGDRFGIKPVVSVTFFIAGIAFALQGLAKGFISLTVCAFLYGIFCTFLYVNMPRIAKIWFMGRRFALANGVMATGMSVGFTVGALITATVLSPMLGGWRNVTFFYGLLTVIFAMLWFFTVKIPRDEASGGGPSTNPMKEALSYVSRIRSVWILGFAYLGFSGCLMGVSGYLALYLHHIGWAPASADGALAAFNIAGAFGAVPIAMVSDRLGVRKPILFSLIFVSVVSTALLPFFDGGMIWVLSIILGFTRDPTIALFLIMNMENKKVGVFYVGTAMGLMSTIARFGAAGAPVAGNWLADFGPGAPFFFWAALPAISMVILWFAEETGWKKRKG